MALCRGIWKAILLLLLIVETVSFFFLSFHRLHVNQRQHTCLLHQSTGFNSILFLNYNLMTSEELYLAITLMKILSSEVLHVVLLPIIICYRFILEIANANWYHYQPIQILIRLETWVETGWVYCGYIVKEVLVKMQSPISNDLEVSLFEMEQYLRNSIGYLRRDRDTHACLLSTYRRLSWEIYPWNISHSK